MRTPSFLVRLGTRSLVREFMILSSALVLVTSFTIAAVVIRSASALNRADLMTFGRNTVELLAQNAEYALYTEDEASLEALLYLTRIDSGVAYLVITDADGKVLASRGRGSVVPPAPPSRAVAAAGAVLEERVSPIDGKRYVEIVAPVRSPGVGPSTPGVADGRQRPVLGHMRLGLSTEQLERKARNFVASVAGLTLLLACLGVGLAVTLARRVARPIEELQHAAREIGGGRFDFPVEARGTVEIADLARAFSAMLLRLRDSHLALQDQAADLTMANTQLLSEVEERRKAEQALLDSQERYALAARAANDGLWDWDLASGEVYYAPRWKTMLGLGEDEIGNRIEDWLGRVHHEDVAKLRSDIDDHLQGLTEQLRCHYRLRDGHDGLRWMLCRGLAVRDERGRPVRMAGSQTDVTGQKLAEERLVHDALHDALTGLPNRALFSDRLEHALRRADQQAARSTPRTFAVLFADLDRFKVVNDSLGHAMGDRLLVEVGRRIRGNLRPGDTAARLGGDEFAVLLEEVDSESQAEAIARRLADKVADAFVMEGHTLYTSASIGITLAGAGGNSAEEILRNADIAMYRAKRAGKRYEVFDSSMHADTMDRMVLETDLRGALERGEFVLHYQPIYELRSVRLVGFEALLRWQHPRRGLVSPAEFIPILEETRLIVPVGRWVLGQACRQVREWLGRCPERPDLRVSVNVSNVQFAQPCFDGEVRDALDAAGLDPRHLALEITESVIMESHEKAAVALEALRALGVTIYLDDFGTGYSSLAYLPRFPIDCVKIDCSFVARMNTHRGDMEVVRAITAIAHNLQMGIIAEGIEQPEQAASLLALQCEIGQGWLYSPAVPAQRASEMLADDAPAAAASSAASSTPGRDRNR